MVKKKGSSILLGVETQLLCALMDFDADLSRIFHAHLALHIAVIWRFGKPYQFRRHTLRDHRPSYGYRTSALAKLLPNFHDAYCFGIHSHNCVRSSRFR
jgi:hypothetical protein